MIQTRELPVLCILQYSPPTSGGGAEQKLGHLNTHYIADSLLVGRTVKECGLNVRDTVQFSGKAEFVVHPEKSVLEPSTEIIYLGFDISSRAMTVKFTAKPTVKIKAACQALFIR